MEVEPTYPFTVCWAHAHLRFRLQTDDETIAIRAGEIFRFWPESSCVSPTQQTVNITVLKTDDGWTFRGSQSSGQSAVKEMHTLMRVIETDTAFAILEHHQDFLTVHGALLARGEDGILIVGPSESGKSTTSCALWADGWQLLADDVTILNPSEATGYPLLRRVSLRHPSRQLLGDDFWGKMVSAATCDPTPEGYVFHPDEIEGQSRARTARLRAIIFLRRLGAADPGPARLSPITNVHALLSLSPYTNVIRHDNMGEAMARLAPLLNQVTCFDLGRGPLADMISAIKSLTPEAALEHVL